MGGVSSAGRLLVLGFALAFVAIWRPALPYLSGQEDQLAYFDRFQGGEFNAGESQRAADFLHGLQQQDEKEEAEAVAA